jgi:hypothetical protein
MWWHALQHWFGVDNASGTAYLAWSGVLSDLGELTLLGGLAVVVRRHNCEVKGCWRLGRHQTAAQHHVCRRHHPDDHLAAGDVHAAHHAARGGADVRED